MQPISVGPVALSIQKVQCFVTGRQDELNPFEPSQRVAQFGIGKQRERRGDTAQLDAGLQVRAY